MDENWPLIAAGLVLAYVLFSERRGQQIPIQVIPIDEPPAIPWGERDGNMALDN